MRAERGSEKELMRERERERERQTDRDRERERMCKIESRKGQ